MRVPLIRLRYFLWVPFLAGLAFAAERIPQPHLIWSYRYSAPPGRAFDPASFEQRRYISCTYLTLKGSRRTVPAKLARCPFLRFLPPEGAQ